MENTYTEKRIIAQERVNKFMKFEEVKTSNNFRILHEGNFSGLVSGKIIVYLPEKGKENFWYNIELDNKSTIFCAVYDISSDQFWSGLIKNPGWLYYATQGCEPGEDYHPHTSISSYGVNHGWPCNKFWECNLEWLNR